MVIFEKAPVDITIVANAILMLYILLSTVIILIIFYFIYIGGAINMRRSNGNRVHNIIIWLMPVLFAANMAMVYTPAYFGFIFLSVVFLCSSMVIFAIFYFWKFRPLLRDGDFRVQSTVAIWTFLDAVILGALFFLFIFRDSIKIEGKFEISYDLIVQVGSVFVSAIGILFTYVMRTEQTQRNAQLQLYQTLEIQSVELFRFECNHPELVSALWFENPGTEETSRPDETSRYVLRQYLCQILNLFEMSVRFRIRGILPSDAFGSWVIWIWEICDCQNFQRMWLDDSDLPMNYMIDLRDIIFDGIAISRVPEGTANSKRRAFFNAVAERFDCHEVELWLETKKHKFLF